VRHARRCENGCIFSGLAALAVAVALAGFCFGCLLFYTK